MDSIIPLGQKNTLVEYMILSGADNRPPMLDKDLYDSWKSKMELYIQNREHGRMILESVEHGLLIWPTIEENGLHAYLEQHELHANEVHFMCERNQDPLALVANHHMTPPHFKTYQSSYNNPQLQQHFLPSQYVSIHLTQHYSSTYPSQLQFNHSSILTSYLYRSQMNHQTLSVLQIAYHSPQVTTQPLTESPFVDSSLAVLVFSLGDDPITCLNKAMAFLTAVASSRSKGSKWSSCSNNAAFQTEDLDTYDSDCDDVSNAKVVLMANISNYGSDVISEVPHSETYLNDMENQSVHAIQDFEKTPVVDGTYIEIQAQQDSMILSVIEHMSKQIINHVNNWEKANKEQNDELVTAELERYKERVKNFEQRLNIDLNSHEKMIDSQMDDMIKEKLALKQQVDSLEQNLSKQIKEKEYLLQTFTVFKNESKEKENKYMKNKIDSEKKIKELDNIILKVGQSAQTVHVLTKPQVFYDNIHKQALAYQNLFYLKKTQRIKPTLYDGIVISNKHVVMPVIGDEETLILKEVVQIVLWYLDSRCSKHMTGNRSQLMNFVSKFLSTFRFRNDHVVRIMGYGDYQLGNVTISSVYYVEGLRHNLFSVGVDLLLGSRDMLKTSLICLLSKASKTKSWLSHCRLSHLNFGTLNKIDKDGLTRGIPKLKFQKDHLCSVCALGKSKKSFHQPKAGDTN
nr:hypothetical protein [Tanacetum cinerariifolium]